MTSSVTSLSLLIFYLLGLSNGFMSFARPRSKPIVVTRMSDGPSYGSKADEISALTSSTETIFSSEDIAKILPHRYPFALVDKVVAYDAGKSAVGVKCVTLNEPQFTGHFPDRPIMPGVMQVEALAQLAGIVCLQMEGAEPGSVFFFAGVEKVKWKKPVVPGDVLVMEVEIVKWKAKFGIAKAKGIGYVDGEVAVEVGEMTFALAK